MPKEPSGAHQALGDLLRRYREAAGLSQEALAEQAGLSPRGLGYLERGRHRPYPATLRRLADALSLTEQEREALTLAGRPAGAPVVPAARQMTKPPTDRRKAPPIVPTGQTATAAVSPLHNLPASLSSFIGREQAQARVRELLTAHRLVTLVGAGGVGKTRLALAVGEETLSLYPDGVWLVELAALTDPGLVPDTVAQALGLHEDPARTVMETLIAYCRGTRLLLVLDNCEHLLAACTALAGALPRAAPDLRILATSREPLGVASERHYRVPSLSVPDPKHLPSPELAGSYEAVRLFTARAQERRDTFALTSANARSVAEICARLDGLPLAIELAAARVAGMSVEAIAARLDDRFRLLSSGAGDLPTRQRTLRATLDWSWDLLEAPERALLSRLSVFAGGWILEAAETVCAGKVMESWSVSVGLDGLVNRSLAQMEESPDGAMRYRLLESVRQHAGEQLAAAGEEAPTRDEHLSYFLMLAEQAMQAFRGPELASWLDRLEQEHDNLRAALNWAHERTRGEEGLRLAAMLSPFWEFRGHLAEGRRRLEEMLAGHQGSPATRAGALNGAGNLVGRQGEYLMSLALHQEALTLRRQVGESKGIAVSLTNVASALFEVGEYEQADAVYTEGLVLYRALGDQSGIATTFNNQGLAARGLGQFERAAALLAEGLALRRAQGDQRGIAESLNNLGLTASAQGEYARAATLFKAGLLLSRDIGARQQLVEALEGLAWAAAALRQPRRAALLGGAAEAERDVLGMPLPFTERGEHDRAILAIQAALDEARFATVWAEGRAMTLDEAVALALKADPTD